MVGLRIGNHGRVAPDAPVLTATAIGTDAIRLTWTLPAANGHTIVGYVLQKWNGSDWTTNANLLTGSNANQDQALTTV